jgi:hypothetical protein
LRKVGEDQGPIGSDNGSFDPVDDNGVPDNEAEAGEEEPNMGMVVKLGVRVVDGECIPVAGLEIGARYKYAQHSSTWSSETTDGDGLAWFNDDHPEPPLEVNLYAGDTLCDTFPVEDGAVVILEV